MTALIIICSIVLVIALLLNTDIRLSLSYIGGEFAFKLKYGIIKLYPKKRKRRIRAVKEAPVNKTDENAEEAKAEENTPSEELSEDEENDEESLISKTFGRVKNKLGGTVKKISESGNQLDEMKGMLDKLKRLWGYCGKSVITACRNIRISGFFADILVSGDDAYKTAIKFGRISAAAYNVIGVMRAILPIKFKTVDVNCDFNNVSERYDLAADVRISLGTALGLAIVVLLQIVLHKEEFIPAEDGSSDKAIQRA